jgi:hypothetical protein
MTRRELQALLDECNGSRGSLVRLAKKVREAVLKAEAKRDPLGMFLLEARARFRETERRDKGKDGKKIEREVWLSFIRAGELGFKAPLEQWWWLLRAGKTPAELAAEADAADEGGQI